MDISADLEIFDESLQEGDEMFCFPYIARDSFIQHILRQYWYRNLANC